jgi:hypothetical protein
VRFARRDIRLVLGCVLAVGVSNAEAVDITNRWVLEIVPSNLVQCAAEIQQSGTSLQIQGTCTNGALSFSGTIDTTTGDFAGDGSIISFMPGIPPESVPCTLAGSASPSGTALSGTLECDGEGAAFTGLLCRNGNLDPGEACDTGFDTQRCCSSACAVEPDGAACTTGSGCQTGEACASGVCAGTPRPSGTSCDRDRDRCTEDACDGSGGCAAGPCSPCCREVGAQCFLDTMCVHPIEPSSVFALTTGASTPRDRLTWKLADLPDTDVSEFGDPTADTDVAICPFYYDELYGPTLLASFRARGGSTCGSRACWKSARNGFRYRDPRNHSDGLTSVLLKAGSGGAARIVARGRGANLSDWPGLPYPPLGVVLRAGTTCWGADWNFGDFQERPGAITATNGQ